MDNGHVDRRKLVGADGERKAAGYLRENGYTIRQTNWRCKSGEIDIVAEKNGIVIFVEVRTRSTKGLYGTPLESVRARKQHQVRQTARIYLHQEGELERRIRFDVIAVQLSADGRLLELRHIENAF
ncbi:YraN family protein [Ferviditalea candida]|uniref:UPF0102 protein VF724_05845 n=1 Tax=Ferviditalea candida TaxID=3108399 RepID=A0ABU5ZF97_9BACL|nr:YraN family protein [Paenibacillaceae bacterium T2]